MQSFSTESAFLSLRDSAFSFNFAESAISSLRMSEASVAIHFLTCIIDCHKWTASILAMTDKIVESSVDSANFVRDSAKNFNADSAKNITHPLNPPRAFGRGKI